MKKKVIWITAGAALTLLIGWFVCRDGLVRSYVRVDHVRLEQYALSLIAEEKTEDRFGPWRVHCYPEEGMVEFHTWGFGLVPSAVYEGFYYSIHNRHHISVIGSFPMEECGDSATWSAGGDNGGESTRFAEHWFWFKAWF